MKIAIYSTLLLIVSTLLYFSCKDVEKVKHKYLIYIDGGIQPYETNFITISNGCVTFIPYDEKCKRTFCGTFDIKENL